MRTDPILRLKQYQASLANSDDLDAMPESIAYRAQQGLRWLSNRALRERLRNVQTKRAIANRGMAPLETMEQAQANTKLLRYGRRG